ncbi:MAG: M20 family metallopeptidase [Acidobacteria bacterium]|nr:M20 family metallopeptidase [Acidobacteriota bacterium]
MRPIKKTAAASGNDRGHELLQYFQQQQEPMLATLRDLVTQESPSYNKGAVDRLGVHIARRFEELGGRVTLHRRQDFGDHIEAQFEGKFAGANSRKPILLLGHYDTVWDVGTLTEMPFKVENGRLWGPGVFDMKAGIMLMMQAIEGLRAVRGGLPRPVTVLLVSDEEVGSNSSRHLTESLAKKSQAVFVLEPATGPQGAVKTWRKGVGEYKVKITGKAAHAGIEVREGASAIVELARQIARIQTFLDFRRGITVNVGVIRGGTRTNVVAAQASADVDVRVRKMSDAPRLEKKFRSLKPYDRRCTLEIEGGVNRPPMERSAAVVKLYRVARGVARSMSMELEESGTGGGSDGNFTAALGVPTLDGLGGVGEGAHARHESIVLDRLPGRAALIAGLIEAVQ